MRQLAGLAILILIAAVPSSALDWSRDPVDQARAQLAAAPLSVAVAPAPRRGGGGGTPGQFDSYVFSLEWTPAFCEGKGSLPECARLTPDAFASTHLALHGLWPDQSSDPSHGYGYCGVDAQTRSLDRGATWCRMPALSLADATMSRLSVDMPGTASCLENHEWYKHGSCSGYGPDEYFARAAGLVEQASTLAFGRFLTAHAGQTVAAADLRAAFESDFGAGSGADLTLTCTRAHGDALLLDVRMHLATPLRPAAELSSMLLPVAGSGNCPSSFLIDPAPGS